MILLRLAEDVISMDNNLQPTRKKQITQELHTHMDGLFTFFIETLQKNTAKFRTLKVVRLSDYFISVTLKFSNMFGYNKLFKLSEVRSSIYALLLNCAT